MKIEDVRRQLKMVMHGTVKKYRKKGRKSTLLNVACVFALTSYKHVATEYIIAEITLMKDSY